MSGPVRTTQFFRLALGAGGLVVIVAGAASLVGVPLAGLVSTVIFLALVVIVNDAVIAPLTLAGAALSRRLLPRGYLTPLVVAAALIGTLSVVALPVLVGINESPDNATVDNRPYRVTWLVLLALTVAAVAVVGAIRSARSAPEPVAERGGPAGARNRDAGRDRAGAVTGRPRGGAASKVLGAAATAAVVAGALRSGRPRRG